MPAATTTAAREIVNRLIAADGLAKNGRTPRQYQDAWEDADIRAYLYGKSTEDIFSVLENGPFGMTNLPTGFVDGHVLPDLPSEEIFSNALNHNQVPVILGSNRDEPTLFMVQDPQYVDSFLGIFDTLKDEQTYRRLAYYGGQSWKASGVDELAEAMTASGNDHVYAYRFDWDEEPSLFGYDLSVALGAGHFLEIAFVFGEFDMLGTGYLYPNDENQRALSESMMSYWAEFAYTGDPGTGRDGAQAPWLAWGEDGKTFIVLDTPTDGGIRMDDSVVSYEALRAELVADAGFGDKREHCATYARMFWQTELFDSAQYDSLGCAGYPPESFPRF